MTDIASLGLRVESSQVVTAKDLLEEFGAEAAKVEKGIERLAQGSAESGKKFEGFSNKLRNALLTFGGIDSRARSALTIFSSAPLGITAAAAAVSVLAKAYLDGSREGQEFAKVIALTGNAAGVSVGQLSLMAQELDNIAGTRAAGAKALAEFVAAGNVGEESLVRFTKIAQAMERDLGKPIAETAKQFAALADEPTKAVIELQKSFKFLTPEILAFIAAHEKSGDVLGAATIAQRAYADALERNLREFNLQQAPNIVKSWRWIKKEAAEAWDAMLGLGRSESPEEILKRLTEARGSRPLGQQSLGLNENVAGNPRQAANDAEEIRITALIAENKKLVAAQNEVNASVEAAIVANRKADEAAKAALVTAKQVAEARLSFDIGKIQRDLSGVLTTFDAFNDELEAQHDANLVSDEAYYARKRSLLNAQADVEGNALAQENKRLSQQSGTAAEKIAIQNKIADNEQRILELRKRADSQIAVSSIEQIKANKDTANSYIEAQIAADRYVETLIKRFQIESQGLGLGEKERQRLRDRSELGSKFDDRKRDLEGDLRRGDIEKPEFDKLLAIEEDALKRSEAAYDEHYKVLLEKQGDWKVGASEAFQNFLSEAQDVAGAVERALSRGFDGALDSLVDFVMTGKGNFGDLAKSILADLLRIQLKIMASSFLKSIFGGMSGEGGMGDGDLTGGGSIFDPGMSFGGGRANGGPVQKGVMYRVNENTPKSEYFVAPTDGLIVPNGGGMGGGMTFNTTINAAPGTNMAQLSAFIDQRDAQLEGKIAANIARGRWKI